MELVTALDSQLRFLQIQEPEQGKYFVVRMILNEGKKRHIRRLWSAI